MYKLTSVSRRQGKDCREGRQHRRGGDHGSGPGPGRGREEEEEGGQGQAEQEEGGQEQQQECTCPSVPCFKSSQIA